MFSMFLFLCFVVGATQAQAPTGFSRCGKTMNCFTIPSNCNSYSACNAVAMYSYNATSQELNIEMSSNQSYMAFGQSPNNAVNKMTGLRGAYCIRGTPPRLVFLFANALGRPTAVSNLTTVRDVTLISTTNDGTAGATCIYKRNFTASSNVLHNLQQPILVPVIAYGNVVNNVTQQHASTGRRFGSVISDWKTNPVVSSTTATPTTAKPGSANVYNGPKLLIATIVGLTILSTFGL